MNGYNHWEYNPKTRTVLATDIEDGITLATVEPYDDADDIGRLIAAAPEMYRALVKVLDDTQNGQFADENKLIALLNAIDGENREFNYMYPIP